MPMYVALHVHKEIQRNFVLITINSSDWKDFQNEDYQINNHYWIEMFSSDVKEYVWIWTWLLRIVDHFQMKEDLS